MKTKSQKITEKAIKQQGGTDALALTIGVTSSTVWRWRKGITTVTGPALVAMTAILKHPDDYQFYADNAVLPGRPRLK